MLKKEYNTSITYRKARVDPFLRKRAVLDFIYQQERTHSSVSESLLSAAWGLMEMAE